MKNYYLFLCLAFILNNANAQKYLSISGVVRDEKNVALPGATIFLTNTKSITAGDNNGSFHLENIQPGNYDLVVKMIGFKPFIKSITLTTAISNLNIRLKPNSLQLKEVTIRPDFNREKYISIFKREFLGRTANARSCVLLNPNVLIVKFDRQKKQLNVSADEFLIIQNKVLGYQIKYLLNNFEFDKQTNVVHYEGYPSFQNLTGNQKEEENWQRNRKAAFSGSINHFFKCVYAGNFAEQGFEVYKILGRPLPGEISKTPKPVVFQDNPISFDSLLTVKDKNIKSLKYADCLYVVYKNEPESRDFVNLGYSVKIPRSASENYISNGQVSLVHLVAEEILIDKNGSFSPSQGLVFEGFWAWEKVADLMPLDYKVEDK